jgi:hypothetical protein
MRMSGHPGFPVGLAGQHCNHHAIDQEACMQPLTHQMWAKHFAELRPYVLAEWPQVAREDLDLVGDDWDGLVELVSRSTGMSADLAVMQLRKLDVAEMGIGSGETDDDEDADEGQASLDQLRLGVGFSEDERDRIVERLSKLNRRLRRFPADRQLDVGDPGGLAARFRSHRGHLEGGRPARRPHGRARRPVAADRRRRRQANGRTTLVGARLKYAKVVDDDIFLRNGGEVRPGLDNKVQLLSEAPAKAANFTVRREWYDVDGAFTETWRLEDPHGRTVYTGLDREVVGGNNESVDEIVDQTFEYADEGYQLVLEVDGREVARAGFDVVEPVDDGEQP